MERDFMGLAKVKDESSEEPIDAAPVRSIPMQWSFSNKNSSTIPQIVPFRGAQQEKPKTGFDALASTGLVSITTSEVFDCTNRKPYTNVVQGVQKNINVVHDQKQSGVHYTIHHPQTKNVTVLPTVTSNGVHSFATSAHNISPSNNNAMVGTTDLRSSPRNSGGPSQLTIFYNGSVCVYDNISSEKAQAIMLLAGNGNPIPPSSSSLATKPVNPIQTPVPTKSSVIDQGFVLNQPHRTTSHWPSPLPVKPINISNLSGRTSYNNYNNDSASVKLGGGVLISPSPKGEPLKIVNSSAISASSALFSSDTVPQFRKKSLARFLEKRKERVISSSSPYAANNKQSEAISGKSLCTDSSGSSPIQPVVL